MTAPSDKSLTANGSCSSNSITLEDQAGNAVDLTPSISREESYIPEGTLDASGNEVGLTHSLRSNAAFAQKLIHDNPVCTDGNPLLEVYRMDPKGKILGKGATATVRLIEHRMTGHKFALKTIQMSKVYSRSKRAAFRREVDVIRALDHPNIVKIVETFTDRAGDFHLVLPYCTGGELFDYLVSQRPARLPEYEVWGFAKNMLGAINYLKKNHVVHRDIKLENYMFTSTNDNASLVLVDFGFSQPLSRKGQKIKKRAGTLYTMSPEVFGPEGASYPADVWAVGVVLFVLLFGQYPFGPGDSTREEMIIDIKTRDPLFPGNVMISAPLKDMLMKMFVKDPKQRMSAAQLLHHPWMTNIPASTPDNYGTPSGTRKNSRSSGGVRQMRRRSISSAAEEEEHVHEDVNDIIHHMARFQKYNAFKKMALIAIAQSMDVDRISALTDAFSAFDTKQDGTITWKEMCAVLDKHGLLHGDEELVKMKAVFDSVDQDHTGYIKYTEFIAASLETRDYEEESIVYEAFRKLDIHRSGSLSKETVFELLKSQIEHKVLDQNIRDVVDEIFGKSDTDHDGQLDFKEFRAALLSRSESEMNDSFMLPKMESREKVHSELETCFKNSDQVLIVKKS